VRMRGALLWVVLSALRASPVAAQLPTFPPLPTLPQPAAQVAPQVAPQAADTLPPAERLRQTQLKRLERLNRPVGQDTIDYRPTDTVPIPPRPMAGAGDSRPLSAEDTVASRLRTLLPGYQPAQYECATMRFEAATRDLSCQADSTRKASIAYQTNTVSADTSIYYSQRRDSVEAVGNPVFTPPGGEPVASRRLIVDTRTQQASAFGAQTRFNQGATWIVNGDLPRIERDMVYASHAKFTSCTLTVPHFHFGANRVKIVRGSIMVASPVKLYFADVPVFWIPFIAQSLARGRASGLLTPRFSVNDVVRSSGGYARRISNVGFYWAMGEYSDATVALDWFSGQFTALTGSLRYRVASKFLQGTVTARQFWRAEGGTELSLNGNHSWQISERSNMNASVAFVSSGDFVRRNTFDPVEATQQITSSGGFTRRFDWGQVNLLGNRSQSLSDDRVDMTLPRATLSLKPITLFRAPETRASWFNNMTWNGGASASRRTLDYPDQPDTAQFFFARADQGRSEASVNQSLSIQNLSLSQNLSLQEGSFLGVPRDSLGFFPGDPALRNVDVRETSLSWSQGISYQQTLIGATTLTPNITISGTALRSDTLELAQSFVSAPTRVSFGAGLSSQLYGLFPGFGPFQAVRHRLNPGVNYQWAPAAEPTDLQRAVFGARRLQPQSVLTLSLSQTFEAKRRPPPEGEAPRTPAPAPPVTDTTAAGEETGPGAPTRREQGQIVTLLSLLTSSVTYDFVEADSAGEFIQGFQTTRLRNEIQSDFLRGLAISFEHELFRDSIIQPTGETTTPGIGQRVARIRSFAPRLAAVNMRFSLNANSTLLRWLGLGTDAPGNDDQFPESDPFNPNDPFGGRRSVTDEASILPGSRPAVAAATPRPAGPRQRRPWQMSVNYTLTRPSGFSVFQESSQMVGLTLNAQPTDLWTMSWRTNYDVDAGGFTDHMVTLTRDMHEWQAHFDFLKTATGNWAFRFEVSLLDLPDLHFDFDQQSVEAGQLGVLGTP
jgi:hypothetical protein